MNDQLFRPGNLKLTEIGAQKAVLNQQTPVLDIGCGAGYTLWHLSTVYHCPVSGVDLSGACVSKAKTLLPKAEIFQADATRLPFPSGQFHAVFMECSLTLFSDPLAALSEAFRVLSPKGYLILSTLSRETGETLSEQGAASLNLLIPALRGIGFSEIECTDHTGELVQFIVDAIFRYGSLEAYLAEASDALGGTVLSCDVSPKNTRYHLLTARKPGAA